jgi:hypothetical protein
MFQCAHGSLPGAGPGRAELGHRGIRRARVRDAELVTPTGAACLRALSPRIRGASHAHDSGEWRGGWGRLSASDCPMSCGCGSGRPVPSPPAPPRAWVTLRCDVDDMTGEELGALRERARNWPILDLTILPLQMKKDRPGHPSGVRGRSPAGGGGCRPAPAAYLEFRGTLVRGGAPSLRREFRTVPTSGRALPGQTRMARERVRESTRGVGRRAGSFRLGPRGVFAKSPRMRRAEPGRSEPALSGHASAMRDT